VTSQRSFSVHAVEARDPAASRAVIRPFDHAHRCGLRYREFEKGSRFPAFSFRMRNLTVMQIIVLHPACDH